ncbi:MAG: hypothetical protein IJY89_00705, partial [Clostridia bacterium]|nr:hypothetical protein [Clostridia bacterium]
GSLLLEHSLYFPTLRTIPNNTHGTYCFTVEESQMPRLFLDGQILPEYPSSFFFDGILHIESRTDCGLTVKRRLFPASDSRCFVERITLESKEEQDLSLSLSLPQRSCLTVGRGTKGVYLSEILHTATLPLTVKKGQSASFDVFYTARIANEQPLSPDSEAEEQARKNRIKSLCDDALVFSCGLAEPKTMMRLAKLRAGESIFETLSGKFHSPGGRAYYAATWCNDQIEYAGPHFAMTGDETAIEASLNAYRSYIPFMSEYYHKLPCSIIAEGLDIWEGAGDRGDAAMYLYGASLFCLYLGRKEVAEELYPAICWCAEYCERRKSPEGIICSDSDELEGRFPTDGKANLSTSSLCYGGLVLLSKLAASLGDNHRARLYNERAEKLEEAIEDYFGATLHGFETYRYSKGFDTLRAWICLPRCVGINTRQEGTLSALLSPWLLTEEGFLTCEKSAENSSDTIWDRSTLYGMKCAFLAGASEQMTTPLFDYCHKRLLCERVPYPVEAYPEGGRRHLSGESALFVRLFTEGLFGIQPEGLDAFSFVPALPKDFPHLTLENLLICGGYFDLYVKKDHWQVFCNGSLLKEGKTDGQRTVIRR